MEAPPNKQADNQAMIERWKQSGLSQEKFCKSEQIPFHRFYYWYKKFCIKQKPEGSGFIKLRSAHPSSHGLETEVCFANGNRIVFHGAVSMEQLKKLVG